MKRCACALAYLYDLRASASAGEGRGPVLSPGSVEPRREAGPAAMGHPSWGSKHGLHVVVVGEGERRPADARSALDRAVKRGGEPERPPAERPSEAKGRLPPGWRLLGHRDFPVAVCACVCAGCVCRLILVNEREGLTASCDRVLD